MWKCLLALVGAFCLHEPSFQALLLLLLPSNSQISAARRCSDCSGNKICLCPRNENIFRHRGNIFPIMCKTKLIIFNLIISSSRHYYLLSPCQAGKRLTGLTIIYFLPLAKYSESFCNADRPGTPPVWPDPQRGLSMYYMVGLDLHTFITAPVTNATNRQY